VLCFWSQARPWELPPIAIIGDVVPLSPPIINVLLKLQLQGQCHNASMKFAMFMIKKCIYNQPSKDFATEDLKEVAVLVRAQGTKHG
jgi:hypothetical protein